MSPIQQIILNVADIHKLIQRDIMKAKELKALIKDTIRKVLREERLLLSQTLIPYVTDEEQAEIEAQFGSPFNYDRSEFINATNCIKYGNQIQ